MAGRAVFTASLPAAETSVLLLTVLERRYTIPEPSAQFLVDVLADMSFSDVDKDGRTVNGLFPVWDRPCLAGVVFLFMASHIR